MRIKGWQGGKSQVAFGFDVERSSVLWPALWGKECAWKAGERQATRKPLPLLSPPSTCRHQNSSPWESARWSICFSDCQGERGAAGTERAGLLKGSPTQNSSWLCTWGRKGERQVCVCLRGDQSHKQTNKQNYIQKGLFFMAKVPLSLVLQGILLDCTALGVRQLLMKTIHSCTYFCPLSLCFQSFLCFPVSYSYHQGLGLEKCMQVSACSWVFQVLPSLSNKV